MPGFVESTEIIGPAGVIELAAALPATEVRALAIICHPHPLFGGSMSNKVVTTTERALRELGAATLRFNFRGVGKSAGSFDQGIGESADLTAVYQHARKFFPEQAFWLAGFSFGSYVATRSANALGANQLISIAPPVESWDFSAIEAPRMPWLVLQGEADEVVSAEAVYRFVERQTPPPALVRFPETSHFFHGKLLELRDALQNYLGAPTAV